MNPAEDFLAEKSKTAAKRAEDDLQLWHAWNNSGRTPEALEPLAKRYDSLFNRKTTEWKAPNVAPTAFRAELTKHFINAAQSFDPERGVAFNTHVQNRLKKAQRYNARYQNIGYIPEDQARYIGPLQRAQNELTDNLGRAPSHAELATHMGLPERKVTSLIGVIRKDVPSSHYESDPSAFTTTRESDVVRLMQRRPEEYLTPQEVGVFNHVYGANGARKMTDTTGIAKQLGLSQPKVSRLKTSIANKIKRHM
jgi:DNA-directed RNA polymerase specialized sigma subunit